MGTRVAHLVTGQMLEFLALDENFVIAELIAPEELIGVPLGESNLRAKYKVTVVCVKPTGGQFTYAGPRHGARQERPDRDRRPPRRRRTVHRPRH